jgi:hypothetical protein
MKRSQLKPTNMEPQFAAFAAAAILGGGGGCGLAELIYYNIKDSNSPDIRSLPQWRVHMGAISVGIVAFMVALFLLERLNQRRKRPAWRSAAIWSPLAALTGIATAIHIPICFVIVSGYACARWAYSKTMSAS